MKTGCLSLLLPALALALLLSGCILSQGTKEQSSILVYLPNTQRTDNAPSAVFSTVRHFAPHGQDEFVTAISALTNSASSLFGEAQILSARLEDGRATLDMSSEYQKLSQKDRALANLTAALTLTRLSSVVYVDIWCEGELFAQNLSVYSAVFEDAALEDTQRLVKLFLPGEGGIFCETSEITLPRGMALEDALANQILARLAVAENFSISPQTRLVSAQVSDGHCVLNLSEEFFATEPSDREGALRVIYSFVNSLCTLPGIEAVTITVSDRAISSYGSFSTVWPMEYSDTITLW